VIGAINIRVPGIFEFIESRFEEANNTYFPLLNDGLQYPISLNVLFNFLSFDAAEKKKNEEYGAAIMQIFNT